MKILITFLSICVLTTFHAKAINLQLHNRPIDSTMAKSKKLKQLYILSTASSIDASNIYKQQFFDEFPSTFKQLDELYGYNYNTNISGPLGKLYTEHIELFNGLSNVNDTLYYKKIIAISIGGHWDADAVNVFQHGLRNRILANPELALYILKNMTDDKIKSFWFFYFDAAHPKKQIAKSLQRIKLSDPKIYSLMIAALDDVLKHSKE